MMPEMILLIGLMILQQWQLRQGMEQLQKQLKERE